MRITHLLDTNVCIQILRGRAEKIMTHLVEHPMGSVAVSSITLGELVFGAHLSTRESESERVTRLLQDFQVVSFTEPEAREYGEIRYELQRKGNPIGQLDLMIAATARAHDWTVVTHNQAEFRRVNGLRLEDWQ